MAQDYFSKREEQYGNLTGEEIIGQILSEVEELYQLEMRSWELRTSGKSAAFAATSCGWKWMEHLRNMDELREGVGYVPSVAKSLQEYQIEAYNMFNDMIARIGDELTRYLFRVQLAEPDHYSRR